MVDPTQLRAIFFYGTIEENWLGHQMEEIYKDKVYLPYLPLLKDGKIAIDLGANIGLVSIFLSKYFDRVIALEPSEEHFDALVRNLQSNSISNVKPIRKAIYIKSGQFPFGGPSDNRTMRSLHMSTWKNGKSDEMVETITLPELFEAEGISRVDLMKLDVEGSETEIVSSDGFKNVAAKIDLVVGETHRWSGRHMNQLVDAFKLNGFKYKTIREMGGSQIFEAKRT